MKRYLDLSNEAPVYTMWQLLEPQVESVRRGLAREFGCDPEEMAITRNASEGLEAVQLGLDLKPGDEVLTTTHDYPRMLTTWRQRERRDGIVLKTISFPFPPPSLDDLAERFERAVTPRTKVILVCHMTNLTGQVFPVKRICRMARERGIETIVDGAHAFAHFPFKHEDLDCDYYGTSLHKWLFAPHGTGFLYVRRSKIGKVWPLMAAEKRQDEDIRKFEEIGTHPAANHNAIAEALVFHRGHRGRAEGGAAALPARPLDEAARRAAPREDPHELRPRDVLRASATCRSRASTPQKLGKHLFDTRRIIVVPIKHDEFEGLRVTPCVYTTTDEVDLFAEAMEQVIARGLPA